MQRYHPNSARVPAAPTSTPLLTNPQNGTADGLSFVPASGEPLVPADKNGSELIYPGFATPPQMRLRLGLSNNRPGNKVRTVFAFGPVHLIDPLRSCSPHGAPTTSHPLSTDCCCQEPPKLVLTQRRPFEMQFRFASALAALMGVSMGSPTFMA